MLRRKSFIISLVILAAALGALLALVKSPLASVFYPNVLAHSFTLLAITGVLFFVCFFSYQLYVNEKDIRYFIVSLSFYVLGVFGFIHTVMVPAFGWGNEALFDISEHYGMFLASFLLLGLIFSFTGTTQERIFALRTKIFLAVNFLIVAGAAFLFLSPGFSTVLFHNVNFFIGLSGIYFLFLLFVLLARQSLGEGGSTRQETDFFTTSLPHALALLTTTATVPFYYQEWNAVWWYYHLLWLISVLLLLLLLRAKKGKNITEILFSSFSIRARLFFIVGLTLVAIIVNGAIDFRLSRNHLQVQTLENLVLMAEMQEGQVLTYLNKIKGRTVDFASDGFINDSLKKILYGDRQAVTDLSRHLSENKLPLDQGVFGIHVMDLNGKVVASSQGNEIGKEDMAMDDVFIQAKGSRYGNAYVSDIVEDHHFGERNIAIMATAPIIDHELSQQIDEPEQVKKESLGIIMLFFKTQELSDILTGKAQTQFGALSTWSARKKTLEMYLVNKDKLMASESRFVMNATLKGKVNTLPVRLCAKSEETSGEYLNYRGVPVFGASMCFSNGWTLLVEIDKDEALATLGDYFQQNLLSGSATFLLIFIVMYLFTIGIISPLQELSGAAQKIAAGDFTARTKLMTRDEFGQLSQVFNLMVENIQKSSADLQQKAKEEEASRLAVANILGDLEITKNKLEEKAKEAEANRLAAANVLEDLEVAKNQLEGEKAKDEAILGSIGDAVMACDKDGRVMLFNGVAQKLTGFSLKEVIGRHYSQSLKFIKESDEKPGNDFINEAIRSGQQTKMANHTLLITKDGRKIPVADSAAPVKNAAAEIIGCVVVFRDVTHEREVDKAKTEFVSIASHQLRTPLTSINWYIEMLQGGDAGNLNDKQKEFLSEVYKGSKRMVQLVNDLLNVSRLETGRLKIEPVPTDLTDFIQEIRKELEPQVVDTGCHVSLEFPEKKISEVNVDKILLRQVIVNLLTNAIRYSAVGKNGRVHLSLAVGPQAYTISIKDNGIGIPKDVQSHIYEKFFRADNARAVVADGNGLGLYLVKQIMDSSGGAIGFSSEVGQGTTFYVTIPLSGMKPKQGEKGLEG